MAYTHERDRNRSVTKHPCLRRPWEAQSLAVGERVCTPMLSRRSVLLLLSHWYTLVLLLSVVLLTLPSPVAALAVFLEQYPIIASSSPQQVRLVVQGVEGNPEAVEAATTVNVTFLGPGPGRPPVPVAPDTARFVDG